MGFFNAMLQLFARAKNKDAPLAAEQPLPRRCKEVFAILQATPSKVFVSPVAQAWFAEGTSWFQALQPVPELNGTLFWVVYSPNRDEMTLVWAMRGASHGEALITAWFSHSGERPCGVSTAWRPLAACVSREDVERELQAELSRLTYQDLLVLSLLRILA